MLDFHVLLKECKKTTKIIKMVDFFFRFSLSELKFPYILYNVYNTHHNYINLATIGWIKNLS